jgi:MFS family permease
VSGRIFRRNYVTFAVEGGLFGGGLMFVNGTTVLPALIESLGGPAWLIALTPSMMLLGLMALPLFTAHWIGSLRWYKPLQLVCGVGQRLPYLVAGLALLMAPDRPVLVMACVSLAPLVSGLFGGISMTGFQQLFIKVIPERRRSSLFAVRFIITALIGIGAGKTVELVLARYPGLSGYGLLHLCAFVLVAVSWIIFGTVHERPTRLSARRRSLTLAQNLKAIPELVGRNRDFVLFLVARFFRSGMLILLPFLAIHFRNVLGRSEEYIGQLLVVQMVGAVLGNAVAGYLGDKFGSKVAMLAGSGLFVALAVWSMTASSNLEFQAVFLLVGLAQNCSEVGNQAMGLSICPAANRSTFLAVVAIIMLPSMLLASWVSQFLWRAGGGSGLGGLAIAAIGWLAVSTTCLLLVRDPRHAPSPERA